MQANATKFVTLPVLLTLTIGLCATLQARSPARTIPILNMNKPKDYRKEKHYVYNKYLSLEDSRIKEEYRQNWEYHEQLVPYYTLSWRDEHLSIGTTDYLGRARSETAVRNEFAHRVFRTRLDSALRAYMNNSEGARHIKRANAAIESLRNANLTIKGNNSRNQVNELRVGYDVLSDATRIEYLYGRVSAGLYQPHLLGSLMGSKAPVAQALSLRASTDLGSGFSSGLGYQFSDTTLTTSIGKSLTPSVSSSLSTTRSLQNSHQQYHLQFTFSF